MSVATAPTVVRPGSLEEARAALAGSAGARLVAGGTALQLEWTRGLPRPERLVDVTGIAALAGISAPDGAWRLGAAATLSDLEAHAGLAEALPLLHQALGAVAAPGIRNLATLGGNVAGRTGCLIPALLVLDARVETFGMDGHRSSAIADWLAVPAPEGEILVALGIPVPAPETRHVFRKIGLRAAFTPSLINAAGMVEIADGRIARIRLAVGGGAVPPRRLAGLEAELQGRPVTALDRQVLVDALRTAIAAPDDAWRSGAYRSRAAAHVLADFLAGPRHAVPRPPRPAFTPAGAPEEVEVSRAAQAERWRQRPDIADKVAGRLAYLTDIRKPGMLVGRILRAGIPHGRIRRIDTSRAEALPGVVAVVTHEDVPGLNGFGIVVQDQPAFCADKVRHAGDAVAAVAAVDEATAEAALALIAVDYEILPAVTDMETALEAGAAAVHAGGNLQRELHFTRGDVAEALAACAHLVEAVYQTPRQMHGFLETEGGYAEVQADGTLLVCAGGQHGRRDRMQLARMLDRPEETIRVVTSPTGGAFGGKDELTVQPALALLALKSGRPVRLQLSRAESVLAGTKRNPMRIRMRTGCDAEGRLLLQEVDLLADCGAYASLSPSVLETALEHAAGPYVIPHVRTRGRLAYTNNGVCGAFRGFGANQMAFAVEMQLDRLAALADLHPVEIRRRNLKPAGAPGHLGQAVGPSERLAEMLDAASASPLWAGPRGASADGRAFLGVGMALNLQGTGLGSVVPDPGGGALRLLPDGRIEAAFGLDEMGQGVLAAISSAVSGALGCSPDDVVPVIGDTGLTPESGSTTAGRSTHVIWSTAQTAGRDLAGALKAAAARRLGCTPDDLAIVPGGLRDRRDNGDRLALSFAELAAGLAPQDLPRAEASFEFPKADYRAGNARFIFAFGATLARVAVDRQTGEVRVLDLHQHTAAGPMLDVAAYLGQVEGGGVQGLGFTLTEDAVMDGGRHRAGNLDFYMLPSVADAPERLVTRALEGLDPGDPYGPRGVGEIGIGAVTPAITAAIADATGFWAETTPVPPEALLAHLDGGGR